jgi:RNA polymerase sigma-70 factor (ECF subfamily)
MMKLAEQPDIEALRKGDETATELLWKQVREPSLRVAYYYTASWDDAQDIFQIVMLKALKKLDQFKSGRDFYAWYYRILVNTCRDWKKEAFRRLRGFLGEHQWNSIVLESSEANYGKKKRLQSLLKHLSRRMRMVFVLRYLEEFSAKEIGEILDISEDTVRVLSMQARRTLREVYEKQLKRVE